MNEQHASPEQTLHDIIWKNQGTGPFPDVTGLVHDVELAHDMAYAAKPYMDDVLSFVQKRDCNIVIPVDFPEWEVIPDGDPQKMSAARYKRTEPGFVTQPYEVDANGYKLSVRNVVKYSYMFARAREGNDAARRVMRAAAEARQQQGLEALLSAVMQTSDVQAPVVDLAQYRARRGTERF